LKVLNAQPALLTRLTTESTVAARQKRTTKRS
jgi:hypothetical protein